MGEQEKIPWRPVGGRRFTYGQEMKRSLSWYYRQGNGTSFILGSNSRGLESDPRERVLDPWWFLCLVTSSVTISSRPLWPRLLHAIVTLKKRKRSSVNQRRDGRDVMR